MVIINTRPEPDNKEFTKKLQQQGYTVYEFPTITTTENMQDEAVRETIKYIEKFDWIIFTSVKGVDAFMHIADALHIKKDIYANKNIAVVGPKTAERVKYYDLVVKFIPSQFTTEQLGKELENIKNKKILLARSDIASKQLAKDLQTKGASVTDIPIYKTEYSTNSDLGIDALLQNDEIDAITFTSPSTITGFFKRVTNPQTIEHALAAKVVSVGPVTTKTAKNAGFKDIYTAKQFTTDNMIEVLQTI
jgi:uroporphyrinogen-III synthase